MTTPANRAPKVSLFGAPVVFEDDTGSWVPGYVAGHPSTGRILVRSYDGREDRVLLVSDDDVTWRRADGTIPFEPTTPADDPIGPALPGPAPVKTMGQVCAEAFWNDDSFGDEFANLGSGPRSDWSRAATAVIAAHEAGREWETVTRWAVRRTTDGLWANGIVWGPKRERALYATPTHAEYGRLGNERLVRITTRRRQVVKS